MTTTPNRRWFQWSLRMLFVVVTVCGILLGWLAWNWEKARERERLIQALSEYPRSRQPDRRTVWLHTTMGVEPPWLWRLMGATNEYGNILLEVDLSEKEDKELDHIKSLLPDYEMTVIPHHSPTSRPATH